MEFPSLQHTLESKASCRDEIWSINEPPSMSRRAGVVIEHLHKVPCLKQLELALTIGLEIHLLGTLLGQDMPNKLGLGLSESASLNIDTFTT